MVPGLCVTLLLGELFEILNSLIENHEQDNYFAFKSESVMRRNASPRNGGTPNSNLEKVNEEEDDDDEIEM